MSAVRLSACVVLLMVLTGCAQRGGAIILPKGVPVIRVRIMQDCKQIKLAANETVWVKSGADMTPHPVTFPPAPGSLVKLVAGAWDAGGRPLGTGELVITPGRVGSASVNGNSYRGRYRLIPTSADSFDVVNDVDVDSYLKSVIPVELYTSWEEETYKAQAIAARTYAIYESKTAGIKRDWDVFSDERSQMYGGIGKETSKSVRAVDTTAGLVAAWGQPGQERIFKAYFSSCCGGKTQSAYDAFGDDYIPPLAEHDRGTTCSISPKFKWAPVSIQKEELSRRMAAWAQRRSEAMGSPRPELKIQGIARIDQAFLNKLDRPVFFYVTDTKGTRFMMRAEDLRSAIAFDAPAGQTVYSGFFKTVNEADAIRFVEGRGYGHGVGLCQWCAQSLARSGWRHEDIVTSAFPGAKIIRAY